MIWDGADIAKSPDKVRSVLGYLPQDFGVYPNLNAVEFLEYLAAVKRIDASAARKRISELIELVNLADAARRPLGGFFRRHAAAGGNCPGIAERPAVADRR